MTKASILIEHRLGQRAREHVAQSAANRSMKRTSTRKLARFPGARPPFPSQPCPSHGTCPSLQQVLQPAREAQRDPARSRELPRDLRFRFPLDCAVKVDPGSQLEGGTVTDRRRCG